MRMTNMTCIRGSQHASLASLCIFRFCECFNTLLQDEREERELRKVEMQTQKAENMIEHEAEIYARPPRTWFQTEQQKKQSAKRARSGVSEEAEETKGKNVKKQKREEANGKRKKLSKQDRAKKQKDQLVEVVSADVLHDELHSNICSSCDMKPVFKLRYTCAIPAVMPLQPSPGSSDVTGWDR